MSRTLVLSYVSALAATLSGIVRVSLYNPEPDIPPSDLPLCVVELGQTKFEQITFNNSSNNGLRFDTYDVTMTLYLGLPTMPKERANALALPYSELFITAFAQSTKLSGNCYDSNWQDPSDNLRGGAYKQLGEHPKIVFTLRVVEQVEMKG